MFIEELIHEIVDPASSVYWDAMNTIPQTDLDILYSLHDQANYHRTPFTEKQGTLAIRLLTKYKDTFSKAVEEIDQILNEPKWRMPFRVLSTNKQVTIEGGHILVEFPFEQELVDLFRKRNDQLHELHRGTWDPGLRKWKFNLTELAITWVGDQLIRGGFQFSEDFLDLYAEVTKIRNDIEYHLPMVISHNDRYILANAHSKVPQLDTDDLVHALFFARDHGVTSWSDDVDDAMEHVNPVTKKLLSNNSIYESVWVDSAVVDVNSFTDLINYGGPTMIIIPGGSELASIKIWAEFIKQQGITSEEISVMFRLPNDKASFNAYIKENGLNNPVTTDTKIVFVSTKITKPLIKSGLKFKTVINLGYYNYMHHTMSTMVENIQNLVYYSLKRPTTQSIWRPHTL
jgi:hypothetical protein